MLDKIISSWQKKEKSFLEEEPKEEKPEKEIKERPKGKEGALKEKRLFEKFITAF